VTIHFKCDHCGSHLQAADEYLGRPVKCPNCMAENRVESAKPKDMGTMTKLTLAFAALAVLIAIGCMFFVLLSGSNDLQKVALANNETNESSGVRSDGEQHSMRVLSENPVDSSSTPGLLSTGISIATRMLSQQKAESDVLKPVKWHENGTLHKKSALEWQTASHADKLATCADFVTKMWHDENFKPSIANKIATVDDVRPFAQELVDFLDAAFKTDPVPEQNRIRFTNQTVSYTAAIGMVAMGWTE